MTTIHDMKQLNPYYIQETLERLLSQLGLFYKPCQANKKKVKDFFLSFPLKQRLTFLLVWIYLLLMDLLDYKI